MLKAVRVSSGIFSLVHVSTEEQRLSAYGGRALGLKVARQLGHWTVDVKVEHYRQRAAWTWFGSGSRDLAPFAARMVQAGASYRF